MSDTFELEISVLDEDIDVMGHVNNVVYLRWIQDVAVAHWMSAADDDAKKSLRWVVLRHEIDYKRPAMPGDTIVARTWVGTARLLAFDRHTQLVRASDNKLLARARTVWCPIDVETGRPTQVSDAVRRRFSVEEENA